MKLSQTINAEAHHSHIHVPLQSNFPAAFKI